MSRKMDYHVHTVFSYDGEQTMDEMCQTMMEHGMEEVCLTEHFDLGHPDEECQGIPMWDLWEKEIYDANQKYPMLRIKKGIEVGDNPICREQIKKVVDSMQFDFVLLSLHLVDNVDPYHAEVFFEGKSRQSCYVRYLESIADEVRHYENYDALAHIGYIGRYAPYAEEEKPVRYDDDRDAMEFVLKTLVQEGKCLEINTKGISKGVLMPDDSIIRRYIELGGELFTFGSDGHRISEDAFWIEEAKEHVRSLGGKYQAGFTARRREITII